MSLSDLKKNASPLERVNRVIPNSIDAFIDDAEHYARGYHDLVKNDLSGKEVAGKDVSTKPPPDNVLVWPGTIKVAHDPDLLVADDAPVNLGSHTGASVQDAVTTNPSKRKKPLRQASFTLTESAITQLKLLSVQHDCSRSQLIRILIHYFNEATVEQQRQIIAAGRVSDFR